MRINKAASGVDTVLAFIFTMSLVLYILMYMLSGILYFVVDTQVNGLSQQLLIVSTNNGEVLSSVDTYYKNKLAKFGTFKITYYVYDYAPGSTPPFSASATYGGAAGAEFPTVSKITLKRGQLLKILVYQDPSKNTLLGSMSSFVTGKSRTINWVTVKEGVSRTNGIH